MTGQLPVFVREMASDGHQNAHVLVKVITKFH